MLRETLQTLTCLSVLSGTYSLHMARDSYRRDDHMGDVPVHTVQQVVEHDHNDNTLPLDHRLMHPLGFLPEMRSSEDTTYGSVDATYGHEVPPKALQELFNADTLDMRQKDVQKKRTPSQGNSGSTSTSGIPNLPPVPHSIANQLMLRSVRGQRQYDVPQIECPPAMDGMERFACPTPDRQGRYRCIDDHVLCDGFIDCPEGEDEDRQACMFYKTHNAKLLQIKPEGGTFYLIHGISMQEEFVVQKYIPHHNGEPKEKIFTHYMFLKRNQGHKSNCSVQ